MYNTEISTGYKWYNVRISIQYTTYRTSIRKSKEYKWYNGKLSWWRYGFIHTVKMVATWLTTLQKHGSYCIHIFVYTFKEDDGLKQGNAIGNNLNRQECGGKIKKKKIRVTSFHLRLWGVLKIYITSTQCKVLKLRVILNLVREQLVSLPPPWEKDMKNNEL